MKYYWRRFLCAIGFHNSEASTADDYNHWGGTDRCSGCGYEYKVSNSWR